MFIANRLVRKHRKLVDSHVSKTFVRCLNVHEYVAMDLFQKYGVNVPKNGVASTAEEAEKIWKDAGSGDMVIKAQILAGGRGLGTFKNGFQGGVHMVTKPGQASECTYFLLFRSFSLPISYAQTKTTDAEKMLNETLVTKQTGEEGKVVRQVYLAERIYSRQDHYFSILHDRAHQGPVMVASPEGGTSIEDVAAATPEKIFKEPIDIMTGPKPEQLERLADALGFKGDIQDQAVNTFSRCYDMFKDLDATLIEINPLVETPDGNLVICDGKLNFDDNAEFRQKDVFDYRDTTQEDPREVEAAKADLNFIGLTGNIGCMVNGAGLAMATMDIISLYGGSPANFLDVGGGARSSQIQTAFEILNADENVRAILVNIFGGIMRCDVIAKGIIAAASEIRMSKPIIVRLQGTNVDIATEMIENSGFRMLMAKDLDDAAQKAVRIADIVRQAEEIQVGVSFELPL